MGEGRSQLAGSRFVVAVGLIGAAAGGWWLGLAITVYQRPWGSLSDLFAASVAALLLGAIARSVQLAGVRAALVLFAAVAGIFALVGPMFH